MRALAAPLLKTLAFGLLVAHFAWFLVSLVGIEGRARPVAIFALVMLAGVVTRGVRDGVASLVRPLCWPSGSDNPYRYGYSIEDGLLAQGDRASAITLLERRVAEDPRDLETRWRLALLERGARPQRAATWLREITRALHVGHEEDARATRLLAELYTGPLADPGAAMRELARLAQRQPDTQEGASARRWLAELKAGTRPDA